MLLHMHMEMFLFMVNRESDQYLIFRFMKIHGIEPGSYLKMRLNHLRSILNLHLPSFESDHISFHSKSSLDKMLITLLAC